MQSVNIFITYLSQTDSGLKLKKKKFLFPLLGSSSGGFVIFGSSLVFDWICELTSCVSKVINREMDLGLAQGISLSDFPASPAHLRSGVTCGDQQRAVLTHWQRSPYGPIVTLIKIRH